MKNYRSYALRLISIRQRSESELRRRLKEKGASFEEIESIVSSFKELGLIDDLDFAREFVRSKAERHWSWLMIENALKYEFGLEDSIVQSMKDEYPEDKVVAYYIKRFRRSKMSIEKVKQYLFRKGFSYSFIKRVIEGLSNIT